MEKYSQLSKYNIVFCALARNCEKNITKNLKRIEHLEKYFNQTSIVILENDSTDNTQKILEKWKHTKSNVVLPNIYHYLDKHFELTQSLGLDKNNIQNIHNYDSNQMQQMRVKRIAFARDCLLNTISQLQHTIDFIIMLDIDLPKFSTNGILKNLSLKEPWDVLLANCKAYAIYSLLPPKIKRIYQDSFAIEKLDKVSKPLDINQNYQLEFANIKINAPLIPVNSAFGGLGIYKFESMFKKYSDNTISPRFSYIQEITKDNFQYCEHISFHRALRKNGFDKIFISPSLTTEYLNFIQSIYQYLTV